MVDANNEKHDDVVFKDLKTGDEVIFHSFTFFKILKECIVQYADKTECQAESLIRQSYLYKLPKSYEDVVFISHEHEYYWSMVIAFGENFWQKEELNVSSIIPDDYEIWENEFIKKNNLNKSSYEYL